MERLQTVVSDGVLCWTNKGTGIKINTLPPDSAMH